MNYETIGENCKNISSKQCFIGQTVLNENIQSIKISSTSRLAQSFAGKAKYSTSRMCFSEITDHV